MRTGDGTLRADIDHTGEGVGIAADFRRGVVDLPVQLLQSQPYRGHAAKHFRDVLHVLDGMGARQGFGF